MPRETCGAPGVPWSRVPTVGGVAHPPATCGGGFAREREGRVSCAESADRRWSVNAATDALCGRAESSRRANRAASRRATSHSLAGTPGFNPRARRVFVARRAGPAGGGPVAARVLYRGGRVRRHRSDGRCHAFSVLEEWPRGLPPRDHLDSWDTEVSRD